MEATLYVHYDDYDHSVGPKQVNPGHDRDNIVFDIQSSERLDNAPAQFINQSETTINDRLYHKSEYIEDYVANHLRYRH